MSNALISHAGSRYPIYYNLSQINGFANEPFAIQLPASIEEQNNQVILDNSSEYYISIARCTIPTAGIPSLIVPIQTGQPNPNLCIYKVQFKLETSANVYNEAFTITVPLTFITQNLHQTVSPPTVIQDLSNQYYWLYGVDTILLMFNNALKTGFNTFATQVGLPFAYNAALFPYITFNEFDRFFAVNLPPNAGGVNYFDQQSAYPHLALFIDNLSDDLLQLSGDSNGTAFTRLYCFNKYNNTLNAPLSPYTVYYMPASQSSLNMWQAMAKIIIAVNYGISTILEYDSPPQLNQTGGVSSSNKPKIPMLTDLEIDRDAFAVNKNYVQFSSSNISQQRLITVTGSHLQSFQLSVYWLDNFGIRHPVFLPIGIPLTIKLALYPKTTSLI